jgi:hypothetical protein
MKLVARETLIVVLDVLLEGEIELLGVREALCLPCLLPRTCKDREEDRRQDCDNRNDDQQFDQSETFPHPITSYDISMEYCPK